MLPTMTAPPARSTAQGHQQACASIDSLTARKDDTTASMLAQLLTPPSNAHQAPYKGFGLYTDVEVIAHSEDPRLAHKHHTVSHLLPLGGFEHVKNKRTKRSELPDEVLSVYDELKVILQQEEEAEKRGTRQDPRGRFKPLELPRIWASSPQQRSVLPKLVNTALETTTTNLQRAGGERKASMPDTEVAQECIDNSISAVNASETGNVTTEEAQERTALNSQAMDEDWEHDSDVDMGESHAVRKQSYPTYKTARLMCDNCKSGHTNLTSLVDHMLTHHRRELKSIYYRCCANNRWNASLLSSVPHWKGVHGWGDCPFPCPECESHFPSIPDVRRHFVMEHHNSAKSTPDISRNLTPIGSVDPASKHPENDTPTRPTDPFQQSHVNLKLHSTPRISTPPRPARAVQEQCQKLADPQSKGPPPHPLQAPLPPKAQGSVDPQSPRNLNIRCLSCRFDLETIPALTTHLYERHAEFFPKLWFQCCELSGTPAGVTLKHLKDVHGWRDALPCPARECNQTFTLLPKLHEHFRAHLQGVWSRKRDESSDARRSSLVSDVSMDLSDEDTPFQERRPR